MRATELVLQLMQTIATEGDLEVVIETGEMNDPTSVEGAHVVNADINKHGDVYIPYRKTDITNSKVILITEYDENVQQT